MVGWHHRLNGYKSANSRRWCRTEESGVLPSKESQKVRHDLATEQQQQIIIHSSKKRILDAFLPWAEFCALAHRSGPD